jgi:deoxyadenosine/deoxycytidine kinase
MFELIVLRRIFIEWIDSILESFEHFIFTWNEIHVHPIVTDTDTDTDTDMNETSEEDDGEEDDDIYSRNSISVLSETELNNMFISETESEFEPNLENIKSVLTPMPRILSLEGNIGAGKTTLIRKLQEKYSESKHILFLPEPVSFWQTFYDSKTKKNILELFYENPKKYAFSFQMLAFQSRYELLRTTIENIQKEGSAIDTIVMERSLDADYHIFAKTMFENGTLEETEWEIYRFVTKERLAEFGVSGIIWLDVPATQCYQRVQERARTGEERVTLDYLRSCEEAHREWLSADLGFVCRVEDALHSEEDMAAIETYLF